MKAKDLMTKTVVTVEEETTIEDAITTLFEKHVGSLVITDDKGKCKGIFTERDALRSVAKKIPLNTHLRKVMSTNVVTIKEDASYAETKRLMRLHRIRHLPVVDKKGRLVGMLTLRRVLDEFVGMSPSKR